MSGRRRAVRAARNGQRSGGFVGHDHLLAIPARRIGNEDRIADSRRNNAGVSNVECCRRAIDSAAKGGQDGVDALVDCRAAGQKRLREGRSAIVLQRTQEWVLTGNVSALRSGDEEVCGGPDQIIRELAIHGAVSIAVVGNRPLDGSAVVPVVCNQRIVRN